MPKLIKGNEIVIPLTITYDNYNWIYYLKTYLPVRCSLQIFEPCLSYWIRYPFYWCKIDTPQHQSCPHLPTRFISFLGLIPLTNLLLSLENELYKLFSTILHQYLNYGRVTGNQI